MLRSSGPGDIPEGALNNKNKILQYASDFIIIRSFQRDY